MKSSDIRQAFFDYFAKHGHQVVASSSLVPMNDPTLLFTNAGMVPFKDIFLGLESPAYQRAVSAQRCVRAGGKHNDLDNVGYTARHHTFFEMLGNFSFGDYFKREAIQYAWIFLTDVLNIPPERLWVTVYKDDDEAADIWLKEIGVSQARFSRCGDEDNFWSMGDTGPCGPCTEIFYDHGEAIPGGPPGSPEADLDRYIEIWNLVFMEYNRDQSGQLHPLPKPSVDTGMGLERITAVVQGVHDNYDIDSFQHLIEAISKLTAVENLGQPSFKVIADHIRSSVFLIHDGIIPGHEGRGYVLRRIIRRAVRHGHQLGLPTPFLDQLVEPFIEVMGDAYPELSVKKNHIKQVLNDEERQFARTLEQGIQLLQSHIDQLSSDEISGEVAFKLYDTYGFPVDLTADIAREQQLRVDLEGFEFCMQQQRQQSQAAGAFQARYHTPIMLEEASQFEGYDENALESEILALYVDNQPVEVLQSGVQATVVLKRTPFYPESGGQVGDTGELVAPDTMFRVDDTQRVGEAIVHHGVLTYGTLRVHQSVMASIDVQRRDAIRLNHTATHLLHAALKVVLGEQVVQKGSLVDADHTRFDFSHTKALSQTELRRLEALVNEQIRANTLVTTETMSLNEAKSSGAVALFNEKYDSQVRVLSIGAFSKELCGGTHVRRTGDIGLFKIIDEYGIASGVRRIDMITGDDALQWVNRRLDTLQAMAESFKSAVEQLPDKVSHVLSELKDKDKELARLKVKLATQSGRTLLDEVQVIGDINLLVKQVDFTDNQALRTTLDQLKSTLDHAVIVLYTVHEGKISVVAGVSKTISARVPVATEFVRHVCGQGGGRSDMAQGGGVLPQDLKERIASIPQLLQTE